jgi:predicted pyridoxine 5'-phosphate oxidase superfamily flavin-nucleotide-binding protein
MKKLDASKLTQEQMDFFKSHLAFLATADANGLPQVGPKQSMKVVDDSHLQYLEKTKAHAFANIKNGSKVAVVVADKPSHTNVRVIGTAHIQDADADGHYPVVIDVETIEA